MCITKEQLLVKVIGWKQVPGFSKYYISEDGVIQSDCRHRKVLKYRLSRFGYRVCRLLSDDGEYKNWFVHRLLAIAYIPNPNNYSMINHKNGIKTDNRLDNLEWCTIHQNNQHAKEFGLLVKGATHPQSKLVLNLDTGIFYDSAVDAWKTITHIKEKAFQVMMTGKNRNRTSFTYA